MKRLYRSIIVLASTAVGTAFGVCLMRLAGTPLAQHLALAPKSAKPAVHDFGDMIADLFCLGYYTGLLTGVVMTLAVFGGLVAGFAFARRVGTPDSSFGLKVA